jgi:hypothetical protein
VLPKRFGAFGLTLHPEKTQMVKFYRPPRRPSDESGKGGTFDFLGFTHFWGRSRAGNGVVKRRTAKDRFSRALRRVKEWCREHRHDPLRAQQQGLARKLRGHYAYFGVVGNFDALARLLYEVTRVWRRWLDKRSRNARCTWARMTALLRRFPLPQPRLVRRLAT